MNIVDVMSMTLSCRCLCMMFVAFVRVPVFFAFKNNLHFSPSFLMFVPGANNMDIGRKCALPRHFSGDEDGMFLENKWGKLGVVCTSERDDNKLT